MSVSAQEFLAQIGRRLTDATTDPRETTLVSALVCCHPTIQRGVPGRHVHNFRVRTVTISDKFA